jgi:hypothetical protein
VFAGLAGAGEWFVASQAAAASTGVHVNIRGVIDIINASFAIGLLFTAIFNLVELFRELRRLNVRRHASDSAHAPGAR